MKTNMTRLCGRAPRGARLEMEAPFGAWGTQTFIAGLTHNEMIAPWIIKGAMDGSAFAAYIAPSFKKIEPEPPFSTNIHASAL
ncbi:ISSpo6, transposase OrfB [Novosphingobium sp. PY1]|uniref:ISSpo6, transposase OrfB n=1 Tax=Ochrobactrum sp. PW1 TaxID=1882222 RepID=A0A292GMG0_9HYPH|nr:ISSpo6, transposase OrfB [Ochrobactrum sp. PW1]GFM29132.1 ISSpo6, transposase OrfB [Novosphingobium sp. PY1]